MAFDPSDSNFAQRVRALDPWWFAFETDGHTFGGRVPRDTNKVDLFFDWAFRFGRVETILARDGDCFDCAAGFNRLRPYNMRRQARGCETRCQ